MKWSSILFNTPVVFCGGEWNDGRFIKWSHYYAANKPMAFSSSILTCAIVCYAIVAGLPCSGGLSMKTISVRLAIMDLVCKKNKSCYSFQRHLDSIHNFYDVLYSGSPWRNCIPTLNCTGSCVNSVCQSEHIIGNSITFFRQLPGIFRWEKH